MKHQKDMAFAHNIFWADRSLLVQERFLRQSPLQTLFALWSATFRSKRLHDLDHLVQKNLQTRELFPRVEVVKHSGRLVGGAAAAFPFAPVRLWARP
jgi:hypothetical protein